jgi:hypothetical protein
MVYVGVAVFFANKHQTLTALQAAGRGEIQQLALKIFFYTEAHG